LVAHGWQQRPQRFQERGNPGKKVLKSGGPPRL
jgi:hypothetical protein